MDDLSHVIKVSNKDILSQLNIEGIINFYQRKNLFLAKKLSYKLEIGLEPLIASFSCLWKYINTQNIQFLPWIKP